MEIAASLQRDIVLLAERREEAMQARTSNPSPTVPPTASTAVSAENAPERAGAGGSRGTERRAATTTPQSTWFSRFSRDVSDRSHVTITSTRRLPGPELPAHAPRQGNDDMQPPAPPSSAPPAPGQPRVLDEAAVNADAANNHSYRITRRFNPDGEEHVHNIVMDESDSDDPFSWMVPRGDRRRGERSISDRREPTPTTPATSYGELMRQRRERTAQIRAQAAPRTDSSPAQASSTRRRRRGWARLDQDGNEIPTDEEEEYERNLAQVRSRALALSAGTAPQRLERPQQQLPPPPPPNQRLSFVPTTQSMLWQAPADVRVRLNPPSPPSGSNGDMSTPRAGRAEAAAGERSDVDVPEAFGSAAPFKPSPLALPLVDLSPQRLSKRHRGAESALVGNPSAKAFAAGR
ncbi:hypothetical protein B0H21DRAFT_427098 [Amylocystis lapponica]|nr:hypothetical protein B0H21DRAFT_427098 [Amylocystis lapponica]